MKNRLYGTFLIALGLAAAPAVLFAHHGAALYDTTKRITVQAVVTDWLWANPHCLLEFDVKDDLTGAWNERAESSEFTESPRE